MTENNPNFIKNELELSLNVFNSLEQRFGSPKKVCDEMPLTVQYLVALVEDYDNEKINQYKELLK